MDHYGRLDVLINNAMASKSGTMLVDHTKEDFDLAVYSGLYAVFFYMNSSHPYLKESKGSYINFASGGHAGRIGHPAMLLRKKEFVDSAV
jgi:NAD(P)-dependent dehydrogenase (short-subunit alcohol dehydrogenase family)